MSPLRQPGWFRFQTNYDPWEAVPKQLGVNDRSIISIGDGQFNLRIKGINVGPTLGRVPDRSRSHPILSYTTALYKPYIGGICWYISRVLSQSFPNFSLWKECSCKAVWYIIVLDMKIPWDAMPPSNSCTRRDFNIMDTRNHSLEIFPSSKVGWVYPQ